MMVKELKKGGVTLCTDSYSHSEIENLSEALESKFNFMTSIHRKKGTEEGTIYERIYIHKESLDEQKHLISPHLHESMLYKIHESPNELADTTDQESINKLIDVISDIGSDIGDF